MSFRFGFPRRSPIHGHRGLHYKNIQDRRLPWALQGLGTAVPQDSTAHDPVTSYMGHFEQYANTQEALTFSVVLFLSPHIKTSIIVFNPHSSAAVLINV